MLEEFLLATLLLVTGGKEERKGAGMHLRVALYMAVCFIGSISLSIMCKIILHKKKYSKQPIE